MHRQIFINGLLIADRCGVAYGTESNFGYGYGGQERDFVWAALSDEVIHKVYRWTNRAPEEIVIYTYDDKGMVDGVYMSDSACSKVEAKKLLKERFPEYESGKEIWFVK